jgi:hypothetical protein
MDCCPICEEVMPRTNHKCLLAWLVRNAHDEELVAQYLPF